MKSYLEHLRVFVCLIACLLSVPAAHAGYVNYVFNPGGSLFSNPLDNGTNDLNSVFGYMQPPIGTAVSVWDAGSQTYTQTSIYTASGWTIDLIVAPGTGMVLTAPNLFTNTFVGNIVSLVPPPAFSGPNGIYLWGSETPVAGTISQNIYNGYTLFEFIVGRDPQVGEKIWTYNDSNGTGFVEDDYTSTGWSNPNLSLTVGESAFFQIGSGDQGSPYLPTVVPETHFTYTSSHDSITITGYTGPSVAVVIPSTINGYPVTTIGDGAFSAFLGNSNPTSLTIPDSVTSIGGGVFDECFGLTNISIGSGASSIGPGTFVDCYQLNAITVNPTNSFYSSVNGILFDKSQATLISYPEGLSGAYAISNSVTSIGDFAFDYCPGLTSITIPNSVTSIGIQAFQTCSGLTNVTMSTNVTSIGENAFDGCSSLTSIVIPNGITTIQFAAFEDCGFTSVTIPSGVISIGTAAFDICGGLTNVFIPNSVTSIANLAFYNDPMTSIIIPNSVTNIGSDAFSHCFNLTGVYFTGNTTIPTNDTSVFQYDNNAVAYYLPSTTGRGPMFDGIPTLLWLPQMQTSEASFVIQTNQFGFDINWASGQTVVVEACTNLANPVWISVWTNTLTGGSCYFSDPAWTNYPSRFYKITSP
jgi:hypothetical protein